MSTGIQERLQLSRTPLDTWTKREQLCLASAVSCSGDQNWITVSRTLKAVCGNGNGNGNGNGGNGNNNINNRPADWYSQKNCAVQYGNLLESVEATKRKKRSSESSAGVSSPATVETPTELLLRRLTEERLAEIKAQMRSDQETYRRIQREIDALQSDADVTEQELQDMWLEIEKEQETRRIEEMKLENRMREREQRKKELAGGNWRNSSNSPAPRRVLQPTDTTAVDMDVEDMNSSNSSSVNKQPAAGAPSPLLTSLLKSPTGNAPAAIPGAAAATGSVARATAPTITSLLTSAGNTVAAVVSSQPAITMKSSTDAAFMSRPISGPPAAIEALAPTTPTLERSPSQSAPTLSMLLEKNKATPAKSEAQAGSQEQPVVDDTASRTAAGADSDEADPNELLEVFPNIDEIIDDIDIDMASVIDDEILKDVDDVVNSPSNEKGEVIDFEDKLDALKREQNKASPAASDKPKSVEVVLGSSDDSNDNIPLAAVASQESKDRGQSGGESTRGTEEAESEEPLASEVTVEEIGETITLISTSSEDTASPPASKVEEEAAAESVTKGEESKEEIAEQTTKLAIPSKAEEAAGEQKTPEDQEESEGKAKKEETEKPSTVEEEKVATPSTPASAPAASSSLHDTDEEESSSLTDSSKPDEQPRGSARAKPPISKIAQDETKAELEIGGTPQPPSAPARTPMLRKLPHRDRSESPMVDDETTTASDHSTARSSTRRRCSSTPVIDSIPNSPASSEHTDDRRETRAATKKLFLSIYATLQESKHAAPFRRPFHEEHAQRHADLCLRPMDLTTIKRNIDSGFIRSLSELHRDFLLMAHNVLVAYKPHTNQHKTARQFVQDCQAIKEFAQQAESLPVVPLTATTTNYQNNTSRTERERASGNKARSGSRKSQRHH
ncbi:bromodomain-containing protein 8 [Drosophila serrata]|uniref:bromodomain-containing protein 8 n=1 Tax=Drosophila serrata TaxID=7274 RepID=UPI000A1D0EE6|nr:bromodomain-containing protein 8 [Drosophila serrata]